MSALPPHPVAILGAGPAGLMAAQVLSRAGVAVDVFDAMPSAGRKFLLAGRGGLNLTHSEPLAPFIGRFRQGDGAAGQAGAVAGWLRDFGPEAVRAWAADLGVQTFVGSSGRVFPVEMKAAPLLRAWLQRLRNPQEPGAAPVRFFMRHRWVGWAAETPDSGAAGACLESAAGTFRLETPEGPKTLRPRAAVLALGGASWPRLGSDGAWVPWLADRGVALAPLRAANCGFDARGPGPGGGWSPWFAGRFAGQPLKTVALHFEAAGGGRFERRGEFVVTATGIEGSLVYAASSLLRDEIAARGSATLHLDLLPDHAPAQVCAAVHHPRGSRSLASHLKGRLGLSGVKMALLVELLGKEGVHDLERLARGIKALPLTLAAPRPVAEAISTAGGVRFAALDGQLMLRALPGVFCAGEMLDWEAPTGGYLLTACLASGRAAGLGAARWLEVQNRAR